VGEGTRSRRPPVALWGVLNVTPDSFSDGGLYADVPAALAQARRLLAEGADVLDVGGESTRPPGQAYGQGATPVPEDAERARVVPVVERLVGELGARVSVDTVKAGVARAALAAGARIVNDVSCGQSMPLLAAAAEAGAELVLMHNRGRGEVDEIRTRYDDIARDVVRELQEAVDRAVSLGVPREHIWVDPGIGFAKTAAQSAELLARLALLVEAGQRVLVGPSRKSFIARLAPLADGTEPPPSARLGGTAAAVTAAVLAGAHAVRVHDVAVMRQAVRVAESINQSRGGRCS
jgi:dihydropteroate synthase